MMWQAPPVILHYHGGGFIAMSSQSHEEYLREWARQTGHIIVSVDYFQAPEHKFPVQLHQCFNAYKVAALTDRSGWLRAGLASCRPVYVLLGTLPGEILQLR